MGLKVRPIFLLVGFSLPLFFTLLLLSLPEKAAAVPQFARRYKVRCSACHTIVPVLNEQGYMFKRLGYHFPPALEEGQVTPWIKDLIKKEPEWSLTNNAALAVTDFSFSAERTTSQGASPSSTSAFQVGSWNVYFGGWIPERTSSTTRSLTSSVAARRTPIFPTRISDTAEEMLAVVGTSQAGGSISKLVRAHALLRFTACSEFSVTV